MRTLCIIASIAWCHSAAGSERCAKCHSAQTRGYAQTGMANSLGRPVAQPSGTLRHQPSRSRVDIVSGAAGMRHRVQQGDLVADYAIDYFVGSGNKGRSYLVNLAGRLFQSPAAYYTDRNRWDLSPGFETETELDFDRPIGDDCLFCHSGRSRQVKFTLNTYESPPFEAQEITCERCHGPSDLHIARPATTNIVNPGKLKPGLRDAVCNQCHLGGEARILNPGRQFWDFKPGQRLEDVFSVYVFDSRRQGPLKVVSHSEQLAASKCSQKSGDRMWCGTCHDPHQKPQLSSSWYSDRCRECHGAVSLARHKQPAEDCVRCHMPRRPTYDGGHTAFTDHQVLRRPHGGMPAQPLPPKLRAWQEPSLALAERNLGLAYISVGERHQSADHINEGFRHLSNAQPQFPNDPAVLTSLGVTLQRKGVPKEAAKLFARASALEPRDARHKLNLAVALNHAGEAEQAVEALEAAISSDPGLRDAYFLLAEIHTRMGQTRKREQVLQRYLSLFPQSLVVRRALTERP